MSKTIDLVLHDRQYQHLLVGGCDEAGRGPLAGPLVCAACVMPLFDTQSQDNLIIDGIDDSKKISEKKRDGLYERIISTALDYSISVIDVDVIDEINILNATKLGMSRAINSLKHKPNLMLIDAVRGIDTAIRCEAIIKGDALSYNIAAASILAKVTRDRLMEDLDKAYPQYGFKKHKGYGTRQHLDAIKEYGVTPVHRKLFVRNIIALINT